MFTHLHLHFQTGVAVTFVARFGHELQVQTWYFQSASTTALLGLVSGVSHHDTVCPCYITFLLSAALILDTEFSIKSDIAVSTVSFVYCARRSSVSARDH